RGRPRRPSLRPAADALARRRGDGAGELRRAQRRLRHRGAGQGYRAGQTGVRVNEERNIKTEEVDAVSPPPRARVPDSVARKRDYLSGFLASEKESEPKGGAGSDLQ